MLVKICGITTEEAARAAAEAGADFIGFVFAESKRKVTPEQAADIAATLPASVKKVGVFVNEVPQRIEQIVREVGLDVVQLHGDEPEEIAQQISVAVIKAFPAEKDLLKQAMNYPCNYVLVDTPSKRRGGSGRTFDWGVFDEAQINREKLVLAGGLHPDNVLEAIEQVKPAVVDVSSGVETDGKKDAEKIRKFIATAKQEEAIYHENLRNAGFTR